MSRRTLFQPATKTLGELFSNGQIYEVPRYQRDYSWTGEQWDDLWQDLAELRRSDATTTHYMGAIVVQSGGGKRFIIVDGQQRIATLSILALAVVQAIDDLVRRSIEPDENTERARLLREKFLSTPDPASLLLSSRLSLNRADNDFYQHVTLQLKEPLAKGKLPASHARLYGAFCFFRDRIAEAFGERASGQELADFLNGTVAERLGFIEIRVEDDGSAYTIFETLNARALELTPADLVKNYLLSRLAGGETDLNFGDAQWKKILGAVGATAFTEFLRHFLRLRRDTRVRRERVFASMKEIVRTREEVLEVLGDLELAAYRYHALEDPEDELWSEYPEECRKHVRVLALLGSTQYKPLLLAAMGFFTDRPDEVRRLLRLCLVISFRHGVIAQRATNELESAYGETGRRIAKGEIGDAHAVRTELREIYLPDDEFRDAFARRAFESGSHNRKLVRYILCELENQRSKADLPFESTSATVEHVLPENPDVGWEHFSEEDRQRFTHRLGNLTLLDPKENQRLAGNSEYAKKRSVYAGSRYQITRDIEADEWTAQAINTRQHGMANLATAVWRFDAQELSRHQDGAKT